MRMDVPRLLTLASPMYLTTQTCLAHFVDLHCMPHQRLSEDAPTEDLRLTDGELTLTQPFQNFKASSFRSLGVLLYTLVYGAMPFDGSNFKRLVKQITTGDYYEPSSPACNNLQIIHILIWLILNTFSCLKFNQGDVDSKGRRKSQYSGHL